MATQLPKKANNLEIIKRSLKLEIERRAPVSNSFGSALFFFFFINSSVYLRTRSKGGEKKRKKKQQQGTLWSHREILNWGLYSMNGIYKYRSHETTPVVRSCGCCHLGPWGAVCSLLHKNRCCLSLSFSFVGTFSTNLSTSIEAFGIQCEVCNVRIALCVCCIYIYIWM